MSWKEPNCHRLQAPQPRLKSKWQQGPLWSAHGFAPAAMVQGYWKRSVPTLLRKFTDMRPKKSSEWNTKRRCEPPRSRKYTIMFAFAQQIFSGDVSTCDFVVSKNTAQIRMQFYFFNWMVYMDSPQIWKKKIHPQSTRITGNGDEHARLIMNTNSYMQVEIFIPHPRTSCKKHVTITNPTEPLQVNHLFSQLQGIIL